MAKYEIDTSIELAGVFINSLSGVYIDPTGVTLYILDPSGVQSLFQYNTTPSSPITRDALGRYHYTVSPGKSGTWSYKWQGSGTAVATSPDTTFVVNPSSMIAG